VRDYGRVEDMVTGRRTRMRAEGRLRRVRAWLNSSPGHHVVGLVIYSWFAIGLAASHTETYGVGLLPLFVLSWISGLAACLGTGPFLSTARLLNGGAVLFVSGVLFLQGTYIAADFDRTVEVQSLGALGVVFVVNTLVCEFRVARARVRTELEAAERDAERHAEVLAALQEKTRELVDAAPPIGVVITVRLPGWSGATLPGRSRAPRRR